MKQPRTVQKLVYLDPEHFEMLPQLEKALRVKNSSAVVRRALDDLAERLLVPSVATERHEGPQVDRTAA